MRCRKGIRFNWFFIKFWVASIVGGVFIGTIVDKVGLEIPDQIESLLMVLLYILPAVFGVPLFLKEK